MSSSPAPPTDGGGGCRSSQLRKDAIFGRWVIFSPARARRPSDFKSSSPANATTNSAGNPRPSGLPTPSCPFCIGREHDCAPEIFRFPAGVSEWRVRVIQNLYPALRRDEDPPSSDPGAAAGEGGHVSGLVVPGYGFHDVVIETPCHGVHLSDLSPAESGEVVLAFKERFLQLASLGSIKYVQVFKNHGASAGASMSHSHSQIMGLPLVPPSVCNRLNIMKEFYDRTGTCSLCEPWSDEILVHQSPRFFAIVPFAASFPFEIWIVPRDHSSYFHEIDKEKAIDFGGVLSTMLKKLSRQLNDPPFNFMIHTSPLGLAQVSLPYAHWFLQIVPQLTNIGGFEIGSGCYINPVFPEDAAKLLRDVDVST